MSSSERVTEAELARSKKAASIARNWLLAEETKMKLAGLDPELEGDGTPGAFRPKSGRSSALARIKEARVSGLEIREFSKGLGEESSSSSRPVQVNPSTLVEQRSLIIRSLVAAGRTPEQIEAYMLKVGPFLDVVATAGGDPAAQSILYSRLMNGGPQQSLTVKDVAEVITMLNQAKQSQPQSDPSNMIAAVAKVFEVAQQSRNNGSDPVTAYQAGMAAVTPLLDRLSETQKLAFTTQLDSLRNELREKDPTIFFSRMRDFAENMGWRPGGSEDVEVLQRRLDLADKDSQRQFEWNKMKYETEAKLQEDAVKERKQAETLKTIVGSLQRAIESPVVKEFGRSVGRSIGADKNSVVQAAATAPAAAAQAQLQNPMEEKFSLTCSTCKRISYFSRSDLLKIEQSANGKWVCSCGAAYGLKNSSSGTDDKNKDNEGIV